MTSKHAAPKPHTPAAPPHAKGTSRPRPRHHHVEAHFSGSETVRDVVLGMSDGLTVPFALAAGLSGAVASSRVILVAGVAELAAGAIAMGLGGYLAAKSEADTWHSELKREYEEVKDVPVEEQEEVRKVFRAWGLDGHTLEAATQAVCSDHHRWVDFMMREELNLSEPDPKRARVSALTIGGSYVAGGAIPLAPYLLGKTVPAALPPRSSSPSSRWPCSGRGRASSRAVRSSVRRCAPFSSGPSRREPRIRWPG